MTSGLAPLVGAAGLEVARARHPAGQAGRPSPVPLARRLCARYRQRGMRAPEVAAAVVATRGAWGVDRPRFAWLLGLSAQALADLEGGQVPLGAVPPSLLAADPFAGVVAALRRPAGVGMVPAEPIRSDHTKR